MKPHYVEGIHAIQEGLSAGVTFEHIYIDAAQKDSHHNALHDVIAKLNNAPISYVPKKELDRMSRRGAHQGIIAALKPYAYADLENVLQVAERAARQRGAALVIILDHITDEGNLGAIARTAEVAGASGLVIPHKRSAEVGLGAYKTSAGAVFKLPIAQVPNIASTLEQLKNAGFWVCAASEHAKELMWDAPLNGKIALVMGSEHTGVSDLVRKRCDFEVAIPQLGTLESLNVAQATSILAYEWLRQNQRNDK